MTESSTFILIIVLTAVFSVLISLLVFAFRNLRMRQYDVVRNRAQLEMLRESLESRIYSLTERLSASEDLWNDVNHLVISAQRQLLDTPLEPSKVVLTEFLKSNNIDRDNFVVDMNLVFVLTPFHPKYLKEFESISKVCIQNGLRCLRGDEERQAGDLLPHTLRLMAKARVIVANINGRNANVFYELGIAYAMDKRIILVSSGSPSDIPIDVRTKRIVVFETRDELEVLLKQELIKNLV